MTTPRRSLEQRLGPLVVLAARLPRFVPFLVVAALLISGLILQGVAGAALLLVLALALGLLLTMSWPALDPRARLLRLAVVGLVVARAFSFLG